MTSLVLLTGSEPRHTFMRKAIAADGERRVLRTYCEGLEQSLDARLERSQADADSLQARHVLARTLCEDDFFGAFNRIAPDHSNPAYLPKGEINDPAHVDDIVGLAPDLVAAFGCSLIKPPLIAAFEGRLLNLHLGLSPYYRGSGTNFFPLVDGRPEYVGATFMHMDAGVDTGDIIHQIRARIFPGDTPHQIGNRLIADAAVAYAALISAFDELEPMAQPDKAAAVKVCRRADFTEAATAGLYRQFEDGLVERYLAERDARCAATPIIENPRLAGLHP